MANKEKEIKDDVLNAVREEAAKIIEEATAEAKRIMEEAKTAEAAKDAEEEKKAREQKAYMNEYVEVMLFKGKEGKYKDDVYVAVNGENCVIKRGERVKIKRKFAEVLDHSQHQDYEVATLVDGLKKERKLADI